VSREGLGGDVGQHAREGNRRAGEHPVEDPHAAQGGVAPARAESGRGFAHDV
jgi:hypothetical protein